MPRKLSKADQHLVPDPSWAALIAKRHLGIDNLEPQGSDRLDFKEVHVANLKAALDAAFKLGEVHGSKFKSDLK